MKKKGTLVEAMIDIFVNHKVVSAQEGLALAIAFERSSKEEFDDFLLEEGLVDDINILRALGEYFNVPAFDVIGYFFDYSLLHKFPKDILLRNAFIPLEVDGNIMTVVASNPSDQGLLSIIGENVSYDIRFRVGLRRDICNAVKEFYDKAPTEINQDVDIKAKQRAIEKVRDKGNKETIVYNDNVFMGDDFSEE